MTDKYRCVHCGGHINPDTMKCEYCGTQYEKDFESPFLRFETYTNPVRTFKSKIRLADYQCFTLEQTSKMAVNSLISQLAEQLAPMVKMEVRYDDATGQQIVESTIKIIEPVND